MTKSRKVKAKIDRANNSSQRTPLGTKPNDECYTNYQDIVNELCKWGNLGKFEGKDIICPCDWDVVGNEQSNEVGIFEYKGKTYKNVYGIRVEYDIAKLKATKYNWFDVTTNRIYTCTKKIELFGIEVEDNSETTYSDKSEPVTIEIEKEDIEEFIRSKLTCNFLRVFTQNVGNWKFKSITASGYNPAIGKGIRFQDIDYSKYDICVTNPPFSQYAEFMNCIVDKIDFICLAPFLNRVTPNIGLPLMLRKCYLGYGIHLGLNFYNPTSKNEYKTKGVACDWITSFDDAQKERNEKLRGKESYVDYEIYRDDYLTMENMTMKDGTHPIRVPGSQIPDNYNGWMFAGINVLEKISFDDYEWYGTGFQKYYNTTNPEANPFVHKTSNTMVKANDKQMFHGIVFRRKTKEEK